MTQRTRRIKIPQNDYGWPLTFYCRTFAEVVVNITGYTATFKVWEYNTPGTLLLTGVGAVIDGPGGVAQYTLQLGDFPTAGEFEGELECTKVGEVSSYQSCVVEVTPSG